MCAYIFFSGPSDNIFFFFLKLFIQQSESAVRVDPYSALTRGTVSTRAQPVVDYYSMSGAGYLLL